MLLLLFERGDILVGTKTGGDMIQTSITSKLLLIVIERNHL
jgi:hypothetical protein